MSRPTLQQLNQKFRDGTQASGFQHSSRNENQSDEQQRIKEHSYTEESGNPIGLDTKESIWINSFALNLNLAEEISWTHPFAVSSLKHQGKQILRLYVLYLRRVYSGVRIKPGWFVLQGREGVQYVFLLQSSKFQFYTIEASSITVEENEPHSSWKLIGMNCLELGWQKKHTKKKVCVLFVFFLK